MDVLALILSWILDRVIPIVRKALGNRGCFVGSIVAAFVLVGLLPACYLQRQGEDWRTWLILGPLATLVVVVMVAATYGLGHRSRSKTDGTALGEAHGDQEVAAWAEPQELANHDSNTIVREMPGTILEYLRAERTECPHCRQEISSRAIVCRFCGRYVKVPKSGPTPSGARWSESSTSSSAEPDNEPTSAGRGERLLRCKRCGVLNPADSSFCGACGAGLEAEGTKRSPSRRGLTALVPRQPVQIARAIPLLMVCVALCAPWYVTDFGEPGAGWVLAMDLSGWTCGVCGLPYVLLLLGWMAVIVAPVDGQMSGKYYGVLWAFRGMLLLWLAEMTSGFFTEGVIGWDVDWSGYWGPKVFTIGVVLALVVELVALVDGFVRKPRADFGT